MDPFMAQVQTNYLKDKLEKIDNSAPDKALVDTLKEILRNQVPTAWKDYEELYRTAVACVVQINLYHPDLMGRRSDRGSLFVALADFAQQAEVIAKSNCASMNVDTACELEEFALEVYQIAGVTADYYDKEVDKRDEDEVVLDLDAKYMQTLRSLCFDFVELGFAKPHLHTHASLPLNPGTMATARLYRELAAYKTQLPVELASSIIVRASSTHMHLVRACIIGPQGTPYANGVFFFDVFLHNYPQEPPKVKFLTTGNGKYRQNPNLYNDGKVCLSLLGTWQGEPWQPNKSTLLQVLVSIQSLILVNDPYFNEPGYETSRNTPQGDEQSKTYNLNLYGQVTDAAILTPLQSSTGCPKEFQDVVRAHFELKRHELDQQLQEWVGQVKESGSAAQQQLMQKYLKGYRSHWQKQDRTMIMMNK